MKSALPKSRASQLPEQRRAAHALSAVKLLTSCDEQTRKLYRSYTDRLGPSILANGLGQALATERAAGGVGDSRSDKPEKTAHRRLYKNVEQWLCGGSGVFQPGDVLDAIVDGSERAYLRAQMEAVAWLVWHKKFCRALLPESNLSDGADPLTGDGR